MARRNPPRKVTYFEPVLPRLARNTIIESTFEVGRRFRCTMRVDCGRVDPGAVIRPDPGNGIRSCPTGWMTVWPRRDLSAGRPHGRRPSRRGGRISAPAKRKPRRGDRGFKISRSSRGICDRSLIRSKRRRNGIVASG